MRRAGHALIQIIAILAAAVALPVLAIRGASAALGSIGAPPEWWDRASVAAAAVFVVAIAYLLWDSRRIAHREEAGVLVDRLRVPPARRR